MEHQSQSLSHHGYSIYKVSRRIAGVLLGSVTQYLLVRVLAGQNINVVKTSSTKLKKSKSGREKVVNL